MKESRDRELHHSSEDVPVSLPVTSEVTAYSRSYLPEYPHSLACKVLFRNLTHPRNGAFGSCSKYSNVSKHAKVRCKTTFTVYAPFSFLCGFFDENTACSHCSVFK